jgi:predicted NAD/FAD-binding protein
MKVAIVGGGVSGLVCAHRLHPHHDVTLFEAGSQLGGHAHTVRADLGGGEVHDVDVGFIVYNEATYPRFTALLAELGVATQPSNMSFSVRDERTGLEYASSGLRALLAQPSNALRPSFARMLVDVIRFNRRARRLVAAADVTTGDGAFFDDPGGFDEITLAEVVADGRWSRHFVDDYLVPLGSAIWSADPSTFLSFPAVAFARFMDNHGLLSTGRRPAWRTIAGGSRSYVDAIARSLGSRVRTGEPVAKIRRRADGRGGVEVMTASRGLERFDRVILAGHSDQMLALLSDPTAREREILGALRYQPNAVTLHTDGRFLPTRRAARASWNYHAGIEASTTGGGPAVAVTYWMNRLQSIRSSRPLLVTLNRHEEIDPTLVLAQHEMDHPVFDAGALAAQRRLAEIQGVDGTYFAGAYWGYGFHEDGVRSALDVCRHFGIVP